MHRYRIIIADDHAIVRKGLQQILSESAEEFGMDEASSAAELLAKAERERYDLALVDISMPGRGGMEILKDLKRAHPRLPVLILSIYPEEQYAVRALRAGASGYLTKSSAPDELVGAIRKILVGKKYLSPSFSEQLAEHIGPSSSSGGPTHDILSDREYQVLCMIGQGKASKEISRILALSGKTVSTYRARIKRKLGFRNIAELIRYVIENGLVL